MEDDEVQVLPDEAEKREFAIREWEQCRGQVHLVLSAIWRLELAAISGYAVFYSWFLGAGISSRSTIDPMYLLIASVCFSWLVLNRLKIEYAILITLGNYSMELEKQLYGGGLHTKIDGWESYLDENRPDDIPSRQVFARYNNTGRAFRLLFGLNFVVLLYFGWPRLLELLTLFSDASASGV